MSKEFKEMCIHIIVMGVSGCGKSTISHKLSKILNYTMSDADDFHSLHNIEKMSSGIPLTDQDRIPWLHALNTWIVNKDVEGISTITACSALKRSYRDILRTNVPIFFIHLTGSIDLIHNRLEKRTGHFMPLSLLQDQFNQLEPLNSDETGVTISLNSSEDEIIQHCLTAIRTYASANSQS